MPSPLTSTTLVYATVTHVSMSGAGPYAVKVIVPSARLRSGSSAVPVSVAVSEIEAPSDTGPDIASVVIAGCFGPMTLASFASLTGAAHGRVFGGSPEYDAIQRYVPASSGAKLPEL